MSFINRNICKSLSSALNSSTYVKLSSQECSEVIIVFYSSTNTDWVDVLDSNSVIPFRILANREFTFRGVSDSSQLSAKCNTGTPTLYYRTQFFGSMTE